MFAFFLVFAVGSFIYATISFMVAVIVWMFTTVFGLIFLAVLILMFLGNLFAPPEDEDDDEGGDPRA